jgi:hypothetical protein
VNAFITPPLLGVSQGLPKPINCLTVSQARCVSSKTWIETASAEADCAGESKKERVSCEGSLEVKSLVDIARRSRERNKGNKAI